jgi:hypothetical protein
MKNKDNNNSVSGEAKPEPHDPYARYRPEDYPGSYEKQSQFQADLANDADFLLGRKEKLEELEQLLAKAEDKQMSKSTMVYSSLCSVDVIIDIMTDKQSLKFK